VALAHPISPPEGYPKLTLSVKTVTPTLAHTGGVTLTYDIEIRNTGAYTAYDATLRDTIPPAVTYTHDAQSSIGPTPTYSNGLLLWTGDVGFDSSVVIHFRVRVPAQFTGTVRNVAVIDHPLIDDPVTATAETIITDDPVLSISKTAAPDKPGAGKPLTYTLLVTNHGQPADNLLVTVTDQIPANTALRDPGDGIDDGTTITWTRYVNLAVGEAEAFVFSVEVGDVPSGTVIANDVYQVAGEGIVTAVGDPYLITIVDPILSISKYVWPDPPGSNREMTYTLVVRNTGSLAEDLVITDRVPTGTEYRRGGTESGGIVSWSVPHLDTGESVQVNYTVYVGDVADVAIRNEDYGVCSDGVCATGSVLTSVVEGPVFEVSAEVDPVAHKPGGGTETEVYPTLVVHNVGAGNALGAQVTLVFYRISVQSGDLAVIPPEGTLDDSATDCGEWCTSFTWIGNLDHGKSITFTTPEGQSTIGGAEGTLYTATAIVTDVLENMVTEPVSGTAEGVVTHYANVEVEKTAPRVVGAGALLTYTLQAYNRGLTTALPPIVTDTVPANTTFVDASDGGVAQEVSATIVVSWTLPQLSPGEGALRTLTVRVDEGLISGTQIVNDDYAVFGYGNAVTNAVSIGPPVTTTVHELGLIDSFKTVTPTVLFPGPGNVLTFTVHVVNSGPLPLTGVTVEDLLPWESTTYLRDAVASAGSVLSDIVSVHWTGDVDAFSAELVTFTVRVDPGYQGEIANTAVISHPDLASEIEVSTVAHVARDPLLSIHKWAWPDRAAEGEELWYTIEVANLGRRATGLIVTDTIPAGTAYVPGSASGDGHLVGDHVRWSIPALESGETQSLEFAVVVQTDARVVNNRYGVRCAEGVTASGAPLITSGIGGNEVFLPLVLKAAP
jgi:uncharacterized repeat protein (TIGR01451 family)